MIKRLTLFLGLALGLSGLQAAEAPKTPVSTPEPASAPQAVSVPAAPAVSAPAVSPTAAPLAPAAPAAVSGAANAAGDDMAVPEEVEDPLKMASEAPITDLKPVSSTVLARMAKDLDQDQSELYFDPEHSEVIKESAPGAWRVDVTALYAELAHRLAFQEDKDARQALNLADLRRDERAKEARETAFADKLAEAVIALVEAGKPKAKEQLETLASKGNRRARQYLGLEKLPSVQAPTPVSATAAASVVSPTAAALSPSATTLSEPAVRAGSPSATTLSEPAVRAGSPTAGTEPAKVERP